MKLIRDLLLARSRSGVKYQFSKISLSRTAAQKWLSAIQMPYGPVSGLITRISKRTKARIRSSEMNGPGVSIIGFPMGLAGTPREAFSLTRFLPLPYELMWKDLQGSERLYSSGSRRVIEGTRRRGREGWNAHAL